MDKIIWPLGRRGLLAGVGAVGLCSSARASFTPPSALRLRQPLSRMLIGNTQFSLPDNIINDTTSNSLNSRKLCFAPTRAGITDLVLAFPGFGLNNPEQSLPVSYTVTAASIEYPLGTTPVQVFFSGSASASVAAGRAFVFSDPSPVNIPAGAQFAVKCDVTWTAGNFWLTTFSAAQLVGEWTVRGTGLASHALDNTALSTTNNIGGFAPVIYGRPTAPVACVGLIGDSIGTLTGDFVDPTIGHSGWGRAMRNAVSFVNLAHSGDTYANYFLRFDGRSAVLRDAITHLIVEMDGNDLYGGASSATLQSNIQKLIAPFLARGVQCYGITPTPRTTSTDNWITSANQTVVSSAVETVRQAYCTALRSNWQGLGLSGYFDLAHAVDPSDSGKWGLDAGATAGSRGNGSGFATLSGGAVTAINRASYNSNSSSGNGYTATSQFPTVVYTYPNTTGSGATSRLFSDGSGFGTNYSVDTPGSGYSYPPMIATAGVWTMDGLHPSVRGWNECIYRAGIAPEIFVL